MLALIQSKNLKCCALVRLDVFWPLVAVVGVKVLYDCVFQALGHFFSAIILYSSTQQ